MSVLTVLLMVIQLPLWFGNGGWIRVWELDRKLDEQVQHNLNLASRNDALEAEVQDLQEGRAAIEERARYELGMIDKDEIFVQLNSPVSKTDPEPKRKPTRTASLR